MTKFSRQHYIMIADTLSKIDNPEERERTVKDFEERFSEDNPRFDAERFRTAIDNKVADRDKMMKKALRG